MGLAASQARLLSLTSRIHDVEYQAQMIQSAKMRLALQEDEAYRKYNDALDAESLTFQNLKGDRVKASFYNLCGLGSIGNNIATDKSYVFRDGNDRLIVPSDIYEGYKEFGGSDPYQFAMYMLTGGEYNAAYISDKELGYLSGFDSSNNSVTNHITKDDTDGVYKNFKSAIESLIENKIFTHKSCTCISEVDKNDNQYSITVAEQKKAVTEALWDSGISGLNQFFEPKEIPADLKDTVESLEDFLKEAKYKIYQRDGAKIYNTLLPEKSEEDFESDKFNYYLRWAKLIEQEVGIEYCTCASDYNSSFDIEKDEEALNQMLQSGKISIDMVHINNNTGEVNDKPTSAASDSNLAMTNKSSLDSTELKRAEAEYEKTMRDVQRKDKRYDMDLNKLETERTALTTEYDSVKKVIQDNIERTFKIFS